MKLTILSEASVKCFLLTSLVGMLCSGCTTTLYSAACDGEIDDVRALLQKGTPVNQGRELWCASVHGYGDVAKLLLQYHADPNKLFKDRENDIPLLAAAGANSFETVKELLDHGALVNASDKDGKTALAMAALMENTQMVELLLSKGAEMDQALKYLEKFASSNTFCNLLSNNARAALEKCKYKRISVQSVNTQK